MWPGFWNSIRVRLVCEELQCRAVSRELRAVLTERESWYGCCLYGIWQHCMSEHVNVFSSFHLRRIFPDNLLVQCFKCDFGIFKPKFQL